MYAYVLQIIVVANHMSGKDTHVRGLRVLGPVECVDFFNIEVSFKSGISRDSAADGDPFPFTSDQFRIFETVR